MTERGNTGLGKPWWVLAVVAIAAALAVGAVTLFRWSCGPDASPGSSDGSADQALPSAEAPYGEADAPGVFVDGSRRPVSPQDGGSALPAAGDGGPVPSGVGVLAGMVFDRESLPAAGAIVTVRPFEGDAPWQAFRPPFGPPAPGLASARVEEDGFFRIEGLPAGRVDVEAGGSGYVRAVQRGVDVPRGGEAWVEFQLESGLSIAGRVLDENGGPIAGAAVNAHTRGPGSAEWAVSAKDGSYELAGLRAGTYDLEADASGFVAGNREEVRAGTTGVDFRLGRAGVISGRVVWRGAGSPIEGADVRATALGPRRMRGGPRHGGPSTRSGADGTFVLDDVNPGRYVVSADAPERAPGMSPELTLAAGQRIEGLVLELSEGARVSGIVLTDPDRQPVPGASVTISQAGASSEERRMRRAAARLGFGRPDERTSENPELSTTTDASGRFELQHVKSGRQLVVAERSGYPEAQVAVQVPEEGDVTGVELKLPAGGAIAGTVYDANGAARIASAMVFARPVSGGMAPAGSGEVDSTAQYRIDGLLPGRYQVMLFRPGSGREAQGPRDMDVSLPQETTVIAGRTATVDFHLGGGVLVHGKVVQAGEPVANASIGFSPEGGPFGGHASTVSGEDGSYQLEGLEPGRYVVRVDRTPIRAEIPDVPDFELNLEIPTGAVAGRVLDAGSGAPVADARVLVLHADAQNPAEPAGPPWSSTAYAGSGRTAQDGTFEVTGLPEGAYELQVSHPDYSPGKVATSVPASGRREGIEVRLEPGARLAGQVLDAQGVGVAEAMVLVADPASGQPVRADMRGRITGMDGRFEISGLAPGRYAVRAIAPGYAASPEQLAEAAVGAEPVVLRLTSGGRLEITVVDSTGQPVAGVRVQVLDPVTGRAAVPGMPFGSSGEPPASDDAGRLTLEHVTPGAWVLAVPAAGGPGTRSPVEVREGETTTATLVAG